MTREIPPPSSALRRSQPPATLADWLAIPAEKRAELIHGRIVYHAMPGAAHGAVQAQVGAAVVPEYHRRNGDADRPGGWWISQEVDMEIGSIGCRPDLVGWLRSEHPKMPKPDARGVVTAAPAWICEVLSASPAATDLGAKRDAYHRAGSPGIGAPIPRTVRSPRSSAPTRGTSSSRSGGGGCACASLRSRPSRSTSPRSSTTARSFRRSGRRPVGYFNGRASGASR